MGDIMPVDLGQDSEVFTLSRKDSRIIFKDYFLLTQKIGKELSQEVLRHYYQDTKRAQQIFEQNPNPLNQQINLNGLDYKLNYTVVPQGALMLENPNSYFDENNQFHDSIVLAGQKHIKGANLGYIDLNQPKEDLVNNKQFQISKNIKFKSDLSHCLYDIFHFLNQKLGVEFTQSFHNVKPFVDLESKTIKIYITDLCASLQDYFLYSPSLQNLRDANSQVVEKLLIERN